MRCNHPGSVGRILRGAGQLAEREVITADDLPMLELGLSPDRPWEAERQRELGEQCEKAMDHEWSEA